MLTTLIVKNVYALFGYESRNGSAVYNPYAQLMPITNVVDAHNDWVTAYNKWGGNSTQPSSVSLPVQSTPKPSSLSTSSISFFIFALHLPSSSFSPFPVHLLVFTLPVHLLVLALPVHFLVCFGSSGHRGEQQNYWCRRR
jgi:hypothetical protein